MAAGKDVPPAEAEDSDSSEDEEEEEEDDSDKEGQKEKESEDEKENDKEDDEDDAFWPAEQFTVAVKYFPELLQVLHRQPMTKWVTLSKTLFQFAANAGKNRCDDWCDDRCDDRRTKWCNNCFSAFSWGKYTFHVFVIVRHVARQTVG